MQSCIIKSKIMAFKHMGEYIKLFSDLENKEPDFNPTLKFVKESIPFSTIKPLEKVSSSDLQQVREWKDSVVKMRDKYKGSELYEVFNKEVKRIIEFLMQERFKDFD